MYLKKFLMTIAAALCMLPLSAINPQNSKMKELNVKKVSAANICLLYTSPSPRD